MKIIFFGKRYYIGLMQDVESLRIKGQLGEMKGI
jgi:hypothetical protein